jgi:hypothetical protein
MLTKSNIALSLALVLGMGSAAIAAAQAPIHHHRAAVAARRAPAAAYQSFGYARGTATAGRHDPQVTCPDGPCDAYNHQQVKCIGGACDPEWGIDDSE